MNCPSGLIYITFYHGQGFTSQYMAAKCGNMVKVDVVVNNDVVNVVVAAVIGVSAVYVIR